MNEEKAAAAAAGKSGNPEDYTCRITAVKNCPSLRIGQLGPTNIVLDYVRAVHVELSTRRDKHIWHFSLNGVPKFLVDAFKFLEDSNAFRIDGIFRKEGSASRLKNAWTIYCGITPMPLECTAHDVCSLIKRFFREIKTPIFDDCQANILKFAESLNNNEETVFKAISAVVERLPAVNAATLTFLLKQLRKVSEYSDANRMTTENLATVFAPSLFRDENPIARTSTTKKKKDDQFNIMNFVRSRNNLQISVIKLLISKSHLLCPPREVKLTRHFSEHFSADKKTNLSATPSNLSSTPTCSEHDEIASPVAAKFARTTGPVKLTRHFSEQFSSDKKPTLIAKPSITPFSSCERDENKSPVTAKFARSAGPPREVKLARHFSERFSSDKKVNLVAKLSIGKPIFSVRDENAPPAARPIVAAAHAALSHPKVPFQVQPAYAFRRTRAFISNYEKICTHCDVRGHLLKECPKQRSASVTGGGGLAARPPWK